MPMGESAKLFFFYKEPCGAMRQVGQCDGDERLHGVYGPLEQGRVAWRRRPHVLGGGRDQFAFFGKPNRTEALEEVLAFLERSLEDKRVRSYLHHVMLDWPQDEHARGAYTGFFPPGVQSQPVLECIRTRRKAPASSAGSDYYTGVGKATWMVRCGRARRRRK